MKFFVWVACRSPPRLIKQLTSSASSTPLPSNPLIPVTQSNMNCTPSRWCGRSQRVSMGSTSMRPGGSAPSGASHSTSGSPGGGALSGSSASMGGGASMAGGLNTGSGWLEPHGTKRWRLSSLRLSD